MNMRAELIRGGGLTRLELRTVPAKNAGLMCIAGRKMYSPALALPLDLPKLQWNLNCYIFGIRKAFPELLALAERSIVRFTSCSIKSRLSIPSRRRNAPSSEIFVRS